MYASPNTNAEHPTDEWVEVVRVRGFMAAQRIEAVLYEALVPCFKRNLDPLAAYHQSFDSEWVIYVESDRLSAAQSALSQDDVAAPIVTAPPVPEPSVWQAVFTTLRRILGRFLTLLS